MRALEAFQEAIMMVDCGAQPWRVLYVNSAFTQQFGAFPLPVKARFLPCQVS